MSEASYHEADAPRGLGLIYGALFRPRETFDAGTMEHGLGMALLSVALVAGVSALLAGQAGVLGALGAFFVYLALVGLSWLVPTGALFVLTRTMRREGEFVPLLAATGLSLLPWIFVAPLAVLAAWGPVGSALAALGTIGLVVWSVRLLIAGVRGVTGLPTGASVLAIVLSQTLVLLLPLVSFVVFVASLAIAFN